MNAIDQITSEILQNVSGTVKIKKKRKERAIEFTGRPALTRRKISRKLSGRTLSDETKKSISLAMCQVWQVTSPTGKKHLVYNLKEFCLERRLNYSAMINVATGRLKQHRGGWICKRAA